MSKVKDFTTSEYERLKVRALKFLSFALPGKKPSKKLVQSLVRMLASEYQRGNRESGDNHYMPYVHARNDLSRWEHFWRVFK